MNNSTDHSEVVTEADEKKLLSMTQQHFSDSLENIDGPTLSQLRKGREKALSALEGSSEKSWQSPAVWGGLASAAMLTAVMIWSPIDFKDNQPEGNLAKTKEVEPVAVEWMTQVEPWQEDLEMLDELEMLTWLVLEEEFAG